MPRITIKDLAKKLNVNISTISRALQKHKDISKEMQETVAKLASKLGYRPNQLAVKLRKRQSKCIAIIMPEISMFFSNSIINSVEEFAHKQGYNLIILNSNDSLQREIENIELCLENGVDGVLISLTNETKDIEHIAELLYADVPVILYDKIVEPSLIHQVLIDDKIAAEQGTLALLNNIKKSNPNILGIFGDPRLSISKKRQAGFLKTLKQQKIKNYSILYSSIEENIYSQLTKIWVNKKMFNGLFLNSDEVLSYALKFMAKKNIKQGTDLEIVVMSDGHFVDLFYPPIPYIHTSGLTMGKKSVEVLFDLIRNKEKIKSPQTIILETPFIDIRSIKNLKK